MVQMQGDGGPAHNVIVPAFLGNEPRLYTIDLAFAPDRKSYSFRYTRHVINKPTSATAKTPRLGIGGSGALYLTQNKKWMRGLLRVVRAYDRGQISSIAVADYLANLNHEVHLGVKDKSVGPRCIVAWRDRMQGARKGGGGHQFYTGTTRAANSFSLPSIANGMDIHSLIAAIMPHAMKEMTAVRGGQMAKALLVEELNAELARLPDKPDENLR
jgi:hypothetical protein